MNKFLTFLVLFFCGFFVCTLTAYGAVGDHLTKVEIFHTIDYGSPDETGTLYMFEFMATTDATVDRIVVDCLGGTREFTITKTEVQNGNEWTFYEYDPADDEAEWEFPENMPL